MDTNSKDLDINNRIIDNYNKNQNNINNEIKYNNSDNNIDSDITDKVKFINDSLKNNIPFKIIYNNYIYALSGVNPLGKKNNLVLPKLQKKNFYLQYNMSKFFNTTIQAIRNNTNENNLKFYIKNKYSELCINFMNKTNNKNIKKIKRKKLQKMMQILILLKIKKTLKMF